MKIVKDVKKGKIIHDFLIWLLEEQGAVICQPDSLYRVTTWKTHNTMFFTEKYLRQEDIKKPLSRKE